MLRGLLRVAGFEYSRIVFRKRFLLVLLSPLLIVLLAGLAGFATVFFMMSSKPVGYVDLTGQILSPTPVPEDAGRFSTDIEIRPFADEASGRAALADGKLEALYVVEADYFETARVRMIAERYPDEEVQDEMEDFLQQSLAAMYPPEIADRLLEGSAVDLIEVERGPEPVDNQIGLKIVIPLVIAIVFTVIVGATSGYMLNAVVDEKTNRTVEILLTSVKPLQLMAGKMIGNLAIGLTQLVVWGGLPLLAFSFGAAFLSFLPGLQLDVRLIGISFGLAFLGVVLFSALLTVLGAAVTESQEAQQISGLMSFAFMVPYFFLTKLMFEPSGTVALVLSLVPLTAPLSMPFRLAYAEVPGWQIALSFGLMLAAVAGALWLAGYAFKRGMMQYHRRLRLKELFSKKGLQG